MAGRSVEARKLPGAPAYTDAVPAAGVIAPLVLAVVLVVSAVAKLRDPRSTRSVLELLRLPGPLRQQWVATALPWGEVALGALLVLAPAGPLLLLTALAVLVLVLGYWVVIARALTFDPRPVCGCFGRIGDQSVSSRTLLRNTLLVALAGTTVSRAVDGDATPASLASLGGDGWAWLLGAGVAALTTWLVVHRSPAGEGTAPAPATDPAPEDDGEDYVRQPIPLAVLADETGAQLTLAESARVRPQLLVLVNCHCGPTHVVAREWAGWRERLPALDVRLVFSLVQPLPFTEGADLAGAWSDHGGNAWAALGLTASPAAVLLGADGLLAGGPVSGVEAIEELVGEIEDSLREAYADGSLSPAGGSASL